MPTKFNFIFGATSQFDWPITEKFGNYGGSPNIECSSLKDSVPPFWPAYIGERRTTFAKAYGIKVSCYGDHAGEHIGNLGKILGTLWEPTGKFKWTHWEHIGNKGKMRKKKKKKNPIPPHPPKT